MSYDYGVAPRYTRRFELCGAGARTPHHSPLQEKVIFNFSFHDQSLDIHRTTIMTATFRRSHVRSTLEGAGRLDLHIVFGTGLTLLDAYSHGHIHGDGRQGQRGPPYSGVDPR